jgi:hypothetical protein
LSSTKKDIAAAVKAFDRLAQLKSVSVVTATSGYLANPYPYPISAHVIVRKV